MADVSFEGDINKFRYDTGGFPLLAPALGLSYNTYTFLSADQQFFPLRFYIPLTFIPSCSTPVVFWFITHKMDTHTALISRMHARQQSWASAARSGSSGSDGSEGSESPRPNAPASAQNNSIPLSAPGPSSQAYSHHQPIRPAPTSNAGGAPSSAPAKQGGQGMGQGQGSGQIASKPKKKREGDGKRRKVAKACLVCQRSHLTCDERE